AALRKLDNGAVYEAAQHWFSIKNPVIVVAGDAKRIANSLSHFAKVTIIDPEHDFQPGRQLPKDENQSLEALPEMLTPPKRVPAPATPGPAGPAPASPAAPATPAAHTPAAPAPAPATPA